MYNAICKFLNQFVDFTDEQLNEFKKSLEVKHLKKGEILLNEGQVCDYVVFINKGAFRLYSLRDGQEYNTEFFFENVFFGDYVSFLTDEKAKESIQAIEASTILILKRKDLYHFYKTINNFVNFGRLIAEHLFIEMASKNDDLLLITYEERYKKLVKERPEVIQRVPQYMIASYLGITPEALSRIRKRLYNE